MRDHEGQIIGVLQLINAQIGKAARLCHFANDDQHWWNRLLQQAAIAPVIVASLRN